MGFREDRVPVGSVSGYLLKLCWQDIDHRYLLFKVESRGIPRNGYELSAVVHNQVLDIPVFIDDKIIHDTCSDIPTELNFGANNLLGTKELRWSCG